MSSKKEKRCFTIMIVPHTEETTFSLRIPLLFVQLAIGFLILGVAGFSVLGYAYLVAVSEAQEADVLRELNRAQQEEIDSLAIETERMMEQLRDVDDLVEFVTEKLELEKEEIEDLEGEIENQSRLNPSQNNPYDHAAIDNTYYFNGIGPLAYNRPDEQMAPQKSILDRTAGNIEVLKTIVPERSGTLDYFVKYAEKASAKPSIWPARGRVMSGYGMRSVPYSSGYQFHTGIDLNGSSGAPVWSTASGIITFAGYRGSLGNLLIIDHGYGYETYYAHLSDFAVKAGDEVERGEVVGYMGASGRTTGVHLHYEVHKEGSPVNPKRYLPHRH